jgi:hypothetical protein
MQKNPIQYDNHAFKYLLLVTRLIWNNVFYLGGESFDKNLFSFKYPTILVGMGYGFISMEFFFCTAQTKIERGGLMYCVPSNFFLPSPCKSKFLYFIRFN